MGKSGDPKTGEGVLGFLEFDVEKEEEGFFVRVIGQKRGGDDGKFGFQSGERELGFGMELVGVKKDEEVEGARGGNGENTEEEVIGEVDDAGGRLRLERGEFGDDGV